MGLQVTTQGKQTVPLTPVVTCRQYTERGLVLVNMGKVSESVGLEVRSWHDVCLGVC